MAMLWTTPVRIRTTTPTAIVWTWPKASKRTYQIALLTIMDRSG